MTTPIAPPKRLIKLPIVSHLYPVGTTSVYAFVKDELLPPPIKLGGTRSVAWIEEELSEVINARIAGASDDEIRRLVAKLVAARTTAHDARIPIDQPAQLEVRRTKRKSQSKNASVP